MTNQAERKGEVVQFQGGLVERFSNLTNQLAALPNQQERYYPVSPIYRGRFGVEGYLFVDHHPEERWHSYTEDGCSMVPYHRGEPSYCGHDVPPTDDPIRLAHFFNTDQGFKLVRFFHLPEVVTQAFAEDEFSGDHLIEKCIRDKTLPKNFDEVKVRLDLLRLGGDLESLGRALSLVNPAYSSIADEHGFPNWRALPEHRVYFSFHPWPWYNIVTQIGEQSIMKALIHFDNALERMNPEVALERRGLCLQDGQPTTFLLPPPTYR